VHDGSKDFTCEICGRKFARIDKLKDHKKRHENIRNHSCEFCNRKYHEKRDLRNHLTKCGPHNLFRDKVGMSKEIGWIKTNWSFYLYNFNYTINWYFYTLHTYNLWLIFTYKTETAGTWNKSKLATFGAIVIDIDAKSIFFIGRSTPSRIEL